MENKTVTKIKHSHMIRNKNYLQLIIEDIPFNLIKYGH